MSAVRFNSIFPTERGVEVTLEIWDTSYASTATAFNTGAEGYTLSYSANGFEQAAQFMATQCEFTFWIENSTHEALITDFLEAPEGRFLIRIYEENALHWTGIVLFDSTSYEERDYPFAFRIKAVDGIGTLKDVRYDDAGTPYAGKDKIITYLCRALSKISYVPEFYGTNDIFLRTAVDWWEETMAQVISGVDMLDQAYITNAVYYDYDKGILQPKSCYDVIKDILTALGCRITYANGAFWIEQLSYRRSETIVIREWKKAGTFSTADTYNSPNTIDQTASGALLSIANYEFTAPISSATHTFFAKERRNFLAGAENVNELNTGIDTFNVPIHSNNGATTLRLTGSLVMRISSDNPVPGYTNPLFPFVALFRINLDLGTNGLQRTYTLQAGYQFTYSPATWNPTPGCYILQPISGPFLANTSSDIFTFTQSIDIMTPVLPENTEAFTFTVGLEGLTKYDGTTYNLADFTITYDLSNLWLEAYSEGSPVLSGEGNIFTTPNSAVGNTLVYKSESLIGSSTNVNTVGALWVKPASDYVLAQNWAYGAGTFDYSFIGQLLTTVIAASRAKPCRKLNGSLYGDILAISRVDWLSENWILIGGSWNAVNNTFTGEWLEMKFLEGLTPSDPTPFGPWIDPMPPGTYTDGQSSTGPFRLAVPPGSLLYPVASTLSDRDIRPGAITSLDVEDVLSDYDFNNGDTIVIVDPFTGSFEELLVTATTTNGQTALSVSGTLIGSYPIGSPIVRLPRIGGGFSLPGGLDGAILRRTSGAWVAYGTSALTDGHVLTWTDAGGWAAAALPASGTVTSVGLTMPTGFSVSGSPVTSSGTLAVSTTLNGNLRGNGSGFVVGAVALGSEVSGILPIANGGTNLSALGSALQLIRVNAGATALEYFTSTFLTANQTITLSGDVTGSGTTAITTTIAANAVTVAKMAQLAGLSILGRASNSTGNMAAITASVASTYLRLNAGGTALEFGALPTIPTISGTAGQVAVFTGASTVAGGVSFLYDSTNFRQQINGAGSVITPTARLDVRMNVVTGTDELFRYRGQVSDTVSGIIENTRNISQTGNAGYVAQVGGTSAGNPFLQFVIPSGETFTMGLDNSDSDKFKLRPQTSLDVGATGGEGLTMTGDVTPLIGINTDTPAFPLDVNGRARALTWTNRTSANSPTHTFGTGAGTGPTMGTVVYPTGNTAQVRFTTGTSPTAGGVIVNIVPTAEIRHAGKVYVVFSPLNAASAGEITKFYIDPSTTTPSNIALRANGALTASTEYYFNFIIMGHA